MTFLLNLLWFVLGGFVIFLLYAIGGVLLCLTIIGIPFGVACWKMVPLAFVPLGQRIVPVERPEHDPFAGTVARP